MDGKDAGKGRGGSSEGSSGSSRPSGTSGSSRPSGQSRPQSSAGTAGANGNLPAQPIDALLNQMATTEENARALVERLRRKLTELREAQNYTPSFMRDHRSPDKDLVGDKLCLRDNSPSDTKKLRVSSAPSAKRSQTNSLNCKHNSILQNKAPPRSAPARSATPPSTPPKKEASVTTSSKTTTTKREVAIKTTSSKTSATKVPSTKLSNSKVLFSKPSKEFESQIPAISSKFSEYEKSIHLHRTMSRGTHSREPSTTVSRVSLCNVQSSHTRFCLRISRVQDDVARLCLGNSMISSAFNGRTMYNNTSRTSILKGKSPERSFPQNNRSNENVSETKIPRRRSHSKCRSRSKTPAHKDISVSEKNSKVRIGRKKSSKTFTLKKASARSESHDSRPLTRKYSKNPIDAPRQSNVPRSKSPKSKIGNCRPSQSKSPSRRTSSVGSRKSSPDKYLSRKSSPKITHSQRTLRRTSSRRQSPSINTSQKSSQSKVGGHRSSQSKITTGKSFSNTTGSVKMSQSVSKQPSFPSKPLLPGSQSKQSSVMSTKRSVSNKPSTILPVKKPSESNVPLVKLSKDQLQKIISSVKVSTWKKTEDVFKLANKGKEQLPTNVGRDSKPGWELNTRTAENNAIITGKEKKIFPIEWKQVEKNKNRRDNTLKPGVHGMRTAVERLLREAERGAELTSNALRSLKAAERQLQEAAGNPWRPMLALAHSRSPDAAARAAAHEERVQQATRWVAQALEDVMRCFDAYGQLEKQLSKPDKPGGYRWQEWSEAEVLAALKAISAAEGALAVDTAAALAAHAVTLDLLEEDAQAARTAARTGNIEPPANRITNTAKVVAAAVQRARSPARREGKKEQPPHSSPRAADMAKDETVGLNIVTVTNTLLDLPTERNRPVTAEGDAGATIMVNVPVPRLEPSGKTKEANEISDGSDVSKKEDGLEAKKKEEDATKEDSTTKIPDTVNLRVSEQDDKEKNDEETKSKNEEEKVDIKTDDDSARDKEVSETDNCEDASKSQLKNDIDLATHSGLGPIQEVSSIETAAAQDMLASYPNLTVKVSSYTTCPSPAAQEESEDVKSIGEAANTVIKENEESESQSVKVGSKLESEEVFKETSSKSLESKSSKEDEIAASNSLHQAADLLVAVASKKTLTPPIKTKLSSEIGKNISKEPDTSSDSGNESNECFHTAKDSQSGHVRESGESPEAEATAGIPESPSKVITMTDYNLCDERTNIVNSTQTDESYKFAKDIIDGLVTNVFDLMCNLQFEDAEMCGRDSAPSLRKILMDAKFQTLKKNFQCRSKLAVPKSDEEPIVEEDVKEEDQEKVIKEIEEKKKRRELQRKSKRKSNTIDNAKGTPEGGEKPEEEEAPDKKRTSEGSQTSADSDTDSCNESSSSKAGSGDVSQVKKEQERLEGKSSMSVFSSVENVCPIHGKIREPEKQPQQQSEPQQQKEEKQQSVRVEVEMKPPPTKDESKAKHFEFHYQRQEEKKKGPEREAASDSEDASYFTSGESSEACSRSASRSGSCEGGYGGRSRSRSQRRVRYRDRDRYECRAARARAMIMGTAEHARSGATDAAEAAVAKATGITPPAIPPGNAHGPAVASCRGVNAYEEPPALRDFAEHLWRDCFQIEYRRVFAPVHMCPGRPTPKMRFRTSAHVCGMSAEASASTETVSRRRAALLLAAELARRQAAGQLPPGLTPFSDDELLALATLARVEAGSEGAETWLLAECQRRRRSPPRFKLVAAPGPSSVASAATDPASICSDCGGAGGGGWVSEATGTADKRPKPVYIVECTALDLRAAGTGPKKYSARRAAAEELLEMLDNLEANGGASSDRTQNKTA